MRQRIAALLTLAAQTSCGGAFDSLPANDQSLWQRCAESIRRAQCTRHHDEMTEIVSDGICLRNIANQYSEISSSDERHGFLRGQGCSEGIVGYSPSGGSYSSSGGAGVALSTAPTVERVDDSVNGPSLVLQMPIENYRVTVRGSIERDPTNVTIDVRYHLNSGIPRGCTEAAFLLDRVATPLVDGQFATSGAFFNSRWTLPTQTLDGLVHEGLRLRVCTSTHRFTPRELEAIESFVDRWGNMIRRASSSAAAAAPLPELPSRSEVARAMLGAAAAVNTCAAGQHGVLNVQVVFDANGRVTSATLAAPNPASSCISDALQRVTVSPFTRSSFSVTFPFTLSP